MKIDQLQLDWFARDTTIVARDLLGKTLCRKLLSGETKRLVITETESYLGTIDSACHSFKGRRTARTEVMYAPAGTIYVYFTYGIHWMLNIVTEKAEVPTAVLIRGAGSYDGPAKLTKALQIDNGLNNKTLGKDIGLWVENAPEIPADQIIATPRIGINSASEPWKSKPLRFVLND